MRSPGESLRNTGQTSSATGQSRERDVETRLEDQLLDRVLAAAGTRARRAAEGGACSASGASRPRVREMNVTEQPASCRKPMRSSSRRDPESRSKRGTAYELTSRPACPSARRPFPRPLLRTVRPDRSAAVQRLWTVLPPRLAPGPRVAHDTARAGRRGKPSQGVARQSRPRSEAIEG